MGSARDRLIRATFWNAAGRVAAGLLGLANMAYAFHALGADRYGLLATTAASMMALVLVEFGLRVSTVHFTAADAARGDAASASATLGAATLFHLVAGGLVVTPFLLFAGTAADLLGADPRLREEGASLLRWWVVFLVLGNAASGWTSVLTALQRTGYLAASMALAGVAQLGTTIAAVHYGWGATALGAGFAAGTVVRAAVESSAAGRVFPGVSILPWRATRAGAARLLSLGRHLQVARVCDVFVFQIDQLLVSRFLGSGAAGVYRLASDLVLKAREAPLLITAGILPAASGAADAGEPGALRDLYLRGTKYVVAAAALAAAFLAAAAPEVMRAAGGERAAAGTAVFTVLILGITANVIVGVGTQVGLVVGQARLQAAAGILSAAVSAIGVPAALALGFGIPGAAAGTALALAAGSLSYLPPLHRALGLRAREVFRSAYLPPLLPAAGVAGAVLLLHRGPLAGFFAEAASRKIAAVLAGEGAVLAAAYAAVLWLTGWVDAVDRDVLRRAWPFAAGEGGR
jgi:O-antigen/teichoic acid export membrane protein